MLQSRLLVSALLALLAIVSGCSSDNGEPVGASPPPVTPSSVTPSVTPSASPSVDEFAFPDDVKLEFETAPTGDETQDAVLEAWMNFEKSVVKAALSEGWSDTAFFRYADVPVRMIIGNYLERKKKANTSVIGTKRYFDVRVQSDIPNVSMVIACEDETLFYGRDLKTGRALTTTPSNRDFAKITAGLTARSGEWIVASYNVEEGVQECAR